MAFSPNSRHKSRFMRGMSQDPNNTNHSCASSTGSHHGTVSDSTVSDFDPENEAIMSTRQMDLNFSQNLPELRDTAKKYGRWNGSRQPDFVINTSAIGRAFPDFSQGGSSDDSMSIEIGRGAKTRQRTSSHQTRPQYSNNIDSPVVTIGDFQILSTPPMKSQPKSSQQQDVPRSSNRKESHSKYASVTQKENIPPPDKPNSTKRMPNYVSGATRTSSGEQRRTLAELHAQVADESEGSFIGEERPAVTLAAKSSRFVNFQPKKSPLVNVSSQNKQKVTDALVDALGNRRTASQTETPSKPPSNGTVTSNTFNPTNQSFLLPNMPDISELVSGTFRDGTPVFTRSGKVQSRFASNRSNWKADHNELDGITVPQDEKDIFLSLQLLQEKVDALEMEKADNQRALEELQTKNYHLQAEKEELKRRHRSDSALGMADSGSDGEYARDNQKLVAEKTKLEVQLKSLQNHLDTSDRKISNLELRLKTNTSERDQAVKQLAEAYYSSEQLKAENDSLRQENESLKQQLNAEDTSLRDENEALRKLLVSENESLKKQSKAEKDLLNQEAESFKEQLARLASDRAEIERNWQQKENSLKRKLQRREIALQELREVTREINVTHETKTRTSRVETTDLDLPQPNKGKRVLSAGEPEQSVQVGAKVQIHEPRQQSKASSSQKVDRGRLSFIPLPTKFQNQAEPRLKSRSRSRSRGMSANEPTTSNKLRAMLMDFEHDVQFDDTTEEGSLDDTTKTIHKDINVNRGDIDHDRTQGSNYSSILGHGEMDRMREILADVKAKQQERLATAPSAQALENDTIRSTRSVRSAPEENRPIQRKPSKKGLTGILKNRDTQDQDDMTGRLSIKSGGHDAAGQDHTTQSKTTHQRRHSETSVRGRTSSRRHIVAEEMTSAFILPDITIHGNSYGAEHKALSAGARKVLDNLAQHDGHNCTVCSRVASFETENVSTRIDTKKTIRIEKPIPVSDRIIVAGPYEDEPTMRPSKSPGLALATVMKGLQDELAHLKMELAQYQSMYNKYDMSLGMRKRKAIKTKIENLLKAIDTKADQIYGLYDVLEGQKQSGQQLSEEDVEITLQSIGIDVDVLKQKTQGGDDHSDSDDSGDDSELDLPWEGIEDTTGTESVKERRQSWRL